MNHEANAIVINRIACGIVAILPEDKEEAARVLRLAGRIACITDIGEVKRFPLQVDSSQREGCSEAVPTSQSRHHPVSSR